MKVSLVADLRLEQSIQKGVGHHFALSDVAYRIKHLSCLLPPKVDNGHINPHTGCILNETIITLTEDSVLGTWLIFHLGSFKVH